jgi:hypothetical protein
MMDEKQFETLDGKLDRALRLLALNVVREAKGDDQIKILAAASFGPAEIAGLLGKKRNAVDQALHRIRLETEQGGRRTNSERKADAVTEGTVNGGEASAKQ